MDQQTSIYYSVQAVNANNAATFLHRQQKLHDAFQLYTMALTSLLKIIHNCQLQPMIPSVSTEGSQRQLLPSCSATIHDLAQPLPIFTEQLLQSDSFRTAHISLAIHYNLGLVLLHLGEVNKSADLFHAIMINDMLSQARAHPTLVLAFYYNMGWAVYCRTSNEGKTRGNVNEDTVSLAIYYLNTAVRTGKSIAGCSNPMLVNVLTVLGKILTNKGDFIPAMLAIEEALTISEQIEVSTRLECEPIYTMGAPSA
jgi:tetratricopeptide (TPR) repeat protein